ncbi:MAG: hypothetical protein AW07_04698 [Candidatus Accumulibacter sp. SK-11]|nr:MAG: hypothetical protein AW07_04698 [Candidatus Accumulibacter sp. SK-11]
MKPVHRHDNPGKRVRSILAASAAAVRSFAYTRTTGVSCRRVTLFGLPPRAGRDSRHMSRHSLTRALPLGLPAAISSQSGKRLRLPDGR